MQGSEPITWSVPNHQSEPVVQSVPCLKREPCLTRVTVFDERAVTL
jgi:hypothetical protein